VVTTTTDRPISARACAKRRATGDCAGRRCRRVAARVSGTSVDPHPRAGRHASVEVYR
jgi:hypothetical protein